MGAEGLEGSDEYTDAHHVWKPLLLVFLVVFREGECKSSLDWVLWPCRTEQYVAPSLMFAAKEMKHFANISLFSTEILFQNQQGLWNF